MSGITFKVKESQFAKKLAGRFESVLNDSVVRTEINQAIAEKCDPYVPYQTGALANNTEITENGIRYKQPYASHQYYGEFEHNKSVHPLATSHWDKVMMQNHKDELNAEIKDIINDRLKELKDG